MSRNVLVTEKYNPDSIRCAVSYWKIHDKTRNFGDFISHFLTENLFFPYTISARRIHLVGSVIDDLFIDEDPQDSRPIVFWGCGARTEDGVSPKNLNLINILSVRGPLTASIFRLGANTPIGDPGFFIPALYQPKKRSELFGKRLCIPHINDRRSDEQIAKESGCDIVIRSEIKPTLQSFFDVIDCIYSASFVFSGSLHGAIVAAAYKKPFGFWDGNGFIDLPFKWDDFSASVGLEAHFFGRANDAKAHYEKYISKNICLPSLLPLLISPPLPLRSSGLIRVLSYEALNLKGKNALNNLFEPILQNNKLLSKETDVCNEEFYQFTFSAINSLNKTIANLSAIQFEVDKEKTLIEHLTSMNNSLIEECHIHEKERERLFETQKELKGKLLTLNQSIEELDSTVKDFESKLFISDTTVTDLKSLIESKEKYISSLNSKLLLLFESNTRLFEKQSEQAEMLLISEKSNGILSTSVSEISRQNISLQEKINQLKEKLLSAERSEQFLSSLVKENENEKQALISEIASNKAAIFQLNTTIIEKDDTISRFKRIVKELELHSEFLTTELNDSTRNCSIREQNITQLNLEIQTLHRQLSELERELTLRNASLQKLAYAFNVSAQ